jgi:hypothetical protein
MLLVPAELDAASGWCRSESTHTASVPMRPPATHRQRKTHLLAAEESWEIVPIEDSQSKLCGSLQPAARQLWHDCSAGSSCQSLRNAAQMQ